MSFRNYLLISHLKVLNANALSSPISIGIPAVTAFLGASHKLQRELNSFQEFNSISFKGVGIIIHDVKLKAFQSVKGFESIIALGVPLKKDGERASTIPNPQIDMDISLIIDVEDNMLQTLEDELFLEKVKEIIFSRIKIAGGDIIPTSEKSKYQYSKKTICKYYSSVEDYDSKRQKEIIRTLIPGYALIERRDLLSDAMVNGESPIEALVDYLAIIHDCQKDDEGNVKWSTKKKEKGWFVPISVGYKGLTNPETVQNQRDEQYLHVFAENLITLGEYKMITNFVSCKDFLWKYKTDLTNSLYMCICEGE